MTDWDAIGAVSELVGALGVVASLIFVGVQIRQGTRATRADTFQSLASNAVAFNFAPLDNPMLIEIVDKAARGAALTSAEHRHYLVLLMTLVRLAQSAQYQHQMGLIDRRQLASIVYSGARHLRTETGTRVWRDFSTHCAPAFRDFMDAAIARSGSLEALFSEQNVPSAPGLIRQGTTDAS